MELQKRWSRRLAWRRRAALLAALALAAGLLRPLLGPWSLLLPLAGLLYPSRLEERRALRQIDRRVGLAWRSAQEAAADHPLRERLAREAAAAARSAELPRFPYLALFASLSLWLAVVLYSPPTQPHSGVVARPPAAAGAREASRPGEGGAAPAQTNGTAGRREQEKVAKSGAAAKKEGANTLAGEKSASTGAEQLQKQPTAGANTRPTKKRPDPAGVSGAERSGGPQEGAAPGRANGVKPRAASAKRPSRAAGAHAEKPEGAAPANSKTPAPQGGRGSQSAALGAGGATAEGAPPPPASATKDDPQNAVLPSPWAAGGPPREVQRAAERYIQSTPLPAEAARALRRYYELQKSPR